MRSSLPETRTGYASAARGRKDSRHREHHAGVRPEKTPLHRVVSENLESWLQWREAAERPVPGYVEDELRGYLECGLLCFGFARALCTGCGHEFVVAFSCKGRGVCPSCNGRHMAKTAAHLADHVIPPGPVRQWVISVPKRLADLVPPPRKHRHRYHGVFAANHKLRPAVTSLAIGNVGKRQEAATGGHGGDGYATEGSCAATAGPRSHDTSRIAWAKLMARAGEEFPLECPNCGGDIRLREDGRQEPAHFEPEVRKRKQARMAATA